MGNYQNKKRNNIGRPLPGKYNPCKHEQITPEHPTPAIHINEIKQTTHHDQLAIWGELGFYKARRKKYLRATRQCEINIEHRAKNEKRIKNRWEFCETPRAKPPTWANTNKSA